MKYVCLVYGEEKEIGKMTDDECMAYDHGCEPLADAWPRRRFSRCERRSQCGCATGR